MRRGLTLLLAGAVAPMLSGCVAAALPLVAAGAIARKEVASQPARPQGEPIVEVLPDAATTPALTASAPVPGFSDASVPPISAAPPPPGEPAGSDRLATPLPEPVAMAGAPAPTPTDRTVSPASVQPGNDSPIEAELANIRNRLPAPAAAADNPYDSFLRFALRQADRREEGRLTETVMLSGPPMNGSLQLLPCGFLPPAVIIDLDDGTGFGLNLAIVDPAQPVTAPQGLANGLEQLRQRDIAVIWMTSQPFDRFDAIAALLRATGLDPSGRDTIVLTRTVSERKQERRADTAASHCILAIAGDRKADFDELYDYLRNPDFPIESDRMIGAGWFLAPQPLALADRPAAPQP